MQQVELASQAGASPRSTCVSHTRHAFDLRCKCAPAVRVKANRHFAAVSPLSYGPFDQAGVGEHQLLRSGGAVCHLATGIVELAPGRTLPVDQSVPTDGFGPTLKQSSRKAALFEVVEVVFNAVLGQPGPRFFDSVAIGYAIYRDHP